MKATIAVHNFHKTLHLRCLTGFWIYLWFWICHGSEYTRALHMPLVLNIPWFWIYQGCTGYVNLNYSSTCLNMLEYVEICMNVPKYAWIILIPHCNPLSIWMCGYLFQCLYKARSFTLKDYEAIIVNQSMICTKLISKNVILLLQKALWASFSLSQKVVNHNVNVKIIFLCCRCLAYFACFFTLTMFLWYILRYNFFILIWGLNDCDLEFKMKLKKRSTLSEN